MLLDVDEERAIAIRLLSKWWKLNFKYFDILTPWPIYHAHSRYPGVRCFREMSNQLVCDTYCQVLTCNTFSTNSLLNLNYYSGCRDLERVSRSELSVRLGRNHIHTGRPPRATTAGSCWAE